MAASAPSLGNDDTCGDRRAALVLAAVVMLCGCGDGSSLASVASPIIGGEPTAGDAAVVLLAAYPDDLSELRTCTATLVGEAVLLTAAHCVDPATHPGYTFGVFAGADATAYPTAAEPSSICCPGPAAMA